MTSLDIRNNSAIETLIPTAGNGATALVEGASEAAKQALDAAGWTLDPPYSVKIWQGAGAYTLQGNEFSTDSGVSQFIYDVPNNAVYMTLPETASSISAPYYNGMDGVLDLSSLVNLTTIPLSAFTWQSFSQVILSQSVVEIQSNAFASCYALASINLENITTFASYCFSGCSSLTQNLSLSGVTVEEYAFAGVPLGSVELSNCVIQLRAFSTCLMTTLTVASDVILSTQAFTYCYNLTSANVQCGMPWHLNSLFENCSSLSSVVLGAAVTTLHGSMFKGCTSLAAITLHEGITSIVDFAFQNTAITTIHLPESLASFGRAVFKSTPLTEYTIEEANPNFAVIDGVLYNDAVTQLIAVPREKTGTLVIPDGVTTLLNDAASTSKIPGVTFPSSLTAIQDMVFQGTLLTTVTVPDTVTTFGNYNFDGCTSLTTAVIGTGLTAISAATFNGCSVLTSVTIPEGVTTIGSHAFMGCSALTGITFPSSLTTISDSLTTTSYGAFQSSGLTSVTLPTGVTSIGRNAFRQCTSLTSVSLPATLATIGNYAFYGCSVLGAVTIPSSVTSVGGQVFDSCIGLASATWNATYDTIPNQCFRGCTNLTAFTVPNHVATLGNYCFWSSGLTSITIGSGLITCTAYSLSASGLTTLDFRPAAASLLTLNLLGAFATSLNIEGCSLINSMAVPAGGGTKVAYTTGASAYAIGVLTAANWVIA